MSRNVPLKETVSSLNIFIIAKFYIAMGLGHKFPQQYQTAEVIMKRRGLAAFHQGLRRLINCGVLSGTAPFDTPQSFIRACTVS